MSIDSLRADHVGAFGYVPPTTPTIDALAARGIAFTRAYSTTSWTLPAHVAMLTGLDDDTHGVTKDGQAIPVSVRTIAEAASAAGVETFGVFSGPYLQPVYGFGRGFHNYRNCSGLGDGDHGAGFSWVNDAPMRAKSLVLETSSCVRAEVDRWAQAQAVHPGNKRFIFIHLWDVHFDYVPPPGYAEIFDPDYAGTTDFGNMIFNPAMRPGISARDLRHLLALYDGEIRHVDDMLAAILDDLTAAGLTKSAAVIITADHGDEFFEHGWKTHRVTLYDEVLHVPLVIAFTHGRPLGIRVNDVVSLIDVAPTICGLLDIRCRDVPSGQNLLAYLDPRTSGRGDALAELGQGMRAYIRENEKVIARNQSPVAEVYTSPDFPGVEHNPARIDRSTLDNADAGAASLMRAMGNRVEQAIAAGRQLRGGVATPAVQIDEATRKRLESLGYLKRAPAMGHP